MPQSRGVLLRGSGGVCLFIFTAVGLISRSTGAQDWPHWRGPERNDFVQNDSGWKTDRWQISEAWRIDTTAGGSAPVVIGDKLLVFGWKAGNDHLTCYDTATGEFRWDQSYPSPEHGRLAIGEFPLYSGPSASPECDVQNGRVFTLSADGELRSWNLNAGGELLWSKNLIEVYHVAQRPKVGRVSIRDYGFTSAPLLLDGQLIVEVGAPASTLIAFDPATGAELWKSQAVDPPGHSGGPVPITLQGVQCVAVFEFNALLVVRCDVGHQGETVCEIPWLTNYGQNVAGPSVQGNSLILTSEYNQAKIVRYDLSLDAPPVKVWEANSSSKVCSPVIANGRIWWAWQLVHCVDFTTGDQLFAGGDVADAASLVHTADNKLILWAKQGDLRLLDAAPGVSEYRELAAFPGLTRSEVWPHVVVAQGRIYCKDRDGTLVCFRKVEG